MIEITTATEPTEEIPGIEVFSIDGVVYSMPAEVPGNMSLRVMESVRQQGWEATMAWALEEVLGTGAYRALLECTAITAAQLGQILTAVQEHIMGQMEDLGKDGSPNGGRKSGGSWTTPTTSRQTSGRSTTSAKRKR
jgi:hypothetical protein